MDKSNKRKPRNNYNADVIKVLIQTHGFTSQFIRQCIRGDRTSITADKIKKEYAAMTRPTEKKIEQFKAQQ